MDALKHLQSESRQCLHPMLAALPPPPRLRRTRLPAILGPPSEKNCEITLTKSQRDGLTRSRSFGPHGPLDSPNSFRRFPKRSSPSLSPRLPSQRGYLELAVEMISYPNGVASRVGHPFATTPLA